VTPKRILIADDHGIFVAGLRHILQPAYDVIGSVADGRSLVQESARSKPDLIIADISMPLLNGIEALRQIRENDKKVKFLFLTMHPDVTYACEAMDAGASGYMLKHSVSSELFLAVDRVLSGKLYISPPLEERVLGNLADVSGGRKRRMTIKLTGRQREVLQLVAEGRSAKEIGAILGISPRTADFHKKELRKHLDVGTTAELVQYALRLGLVKPTVEKQPGD
jgi:DNA-binding NarL/FixJ family response regulator